MQDPRDNRVTAGGVGWQNFAGEMLTLKHGSHRRAVADFGGHFERAKWGGVAAGPVTKAVLGGGDRVVADEDAVVHDDQPLLRDADDDRRGGEGVGAHAG